MASVENTNRFSALELDDDGNSVPKKAPKKQAPKEEEKPQQQQVQTEQKDRTRVSDRNRRGRGGNNNGEFRGRGGRGAHRGGYIGDGTRREFDRRGAPGDDRPRGRARKGGVGLGRYDGLENERRNRPARDETDPTVEPQEAAAADATATTDATASDAAAASDATAAVEEVVAEPVVEEEVDTSLTLDEFQAQQRAKVVDSDINRQLRAVEINDKQWSKISKALEGKKKFKLNAKGEEVPVEEEERAPVEKKQQKKQVLSLDEFVGSTPAATQPKQERTDDYVPRGGRGGASGEFRGRGRGRGGDRGRGFGRGGRGRGGFRNPQVAIDDKNAFPDLSAAAKKN